MEVPLLKNARKPLPEWEIICILRRKGMKRQHGAAPGIIKGGKMPA
jgi:hypothetical protein